MCEVHKNKKVKFFCKSDHEMFCSKCVLKHTNAKHDVMPCSYKSKSNQDSMAVSELQEVVQGKER